MINPDYFSTKGNDKTPAPIAVDIKAKILPLIDPGVNTPNHLFKQDLFLTSLNVTFYNSF